MGTSKLVLILIVSAALILLLASSAAANIPSRPRSVILPVRRDASTRQYLTRISQRTPLVPLTLSIHLGGEYTWVNCESGYVSSSYRPLSCRSKLCPPLYNTCGGECYGRPSPGCNNDSCNAFPENPFVGLSTVGERGEDIISIAPKDGGSNPIVLPSFVFVCTRRILLPGLAKGAKGLVGLGRSLNSLPTQFAAAFRFPRKFALCLPSSTTGQGALFFGKGRNVQLSYTPLYINPVSTGGTHFSGEKSIEYFIGVKSITIGGHPLRINNTLLKIDKEGNGGAKFSTADRFSLLETSIYTAFTSAFIREAEARNISRVVPSIAPFDVCFSRRNVVATRAGPSVPEIRLALDGKNGPVWTITGSNSVVEVNDKTLCLGFLDGGANPRTAIVIGGLQIENNLLEFDSRRSRLGFSSTLLEHQTTCSSFNFTTATHGAP